MKRFWYLLSPTAFEMIIYIMLSIVLLLAGSYRQIFQQLENQPKATDGFTTAIQFDPSQFSDLLQTQNWLAIASTAFFWSIVGLVLAFVGWAFINTLIDFYNTYVVATNFMHPRSFDQGSWWGDYILRMMLRTVAGASLIMYSFVLARFLYPTFLSLFRNFIDNITNPGQWFFVLLAVAGLSISLHVVVILFRILAMKPRILENR